MTDKSEQPEIEIKYDTPIEVSKEQYLLIINKFCGVVAHREHEGKYYIKVWVMGYANKIKEILKIKK